MRQETPIGCLPAMGMILLTVLTVLQGFGLGKGVPRLVQRSGSLARCSQGTQLSLLRHLQTRRIGLLRAEQLHRWGVRSERQRGPGGNAGAAWA